MRVLCTLRPGLITQITYKPLKNLYKNDQSGLINYLDERPNINRIFTEFTWAIRNGYSVQRYLLKANLMATQEVKTIISGGFSDISGFLETMFIKNKSPEIKKDIDALNAAIAFLSGPDFDKSNLISEIQKLRPELQEPQSLEQRHAIFYLCVEIVMSDDIVHEEQLVLNDIMINLGIDVASFSKCGLTLNDAFNILKDLSQEGKEYLSTFIIELVGADGEFSPEELICVTDIVNEIGLDDTLLIELNKKHPVSQTTEWITNDAQKSWIDLVNGRVAAMPLNSDYTGLRSGGDMLYGGGVDGLGAMHFDEYKSNEFQVPESKRREVALGRIGGLLSIRDFIQSEGSKAQKFHLDASIQGALLYASSIGINIKEFLN